jgi:nucleotide-binding universal stress UspA family protein
MPTIIAATDGSPSANAAVERALAEAAASNATVDLVGAWSAPPNGTLGAPTYMSEDVFYAGRDATAKILEDAKARADGAGVLAETHLVAGSAAVEICKLAEERKADLIIMGSRGHRPLAAALLGSVAAHVVRHAHCPVMVVPDPDRVNGHRAGLTRSGVRSPP